MTTTDARIRSRPDSTTGRTSERGREQKSHQNAKQSNVACSKAIITYIAAIIISLRALLLIASS